VTNPEHFGNPAHNLTCPAALTSSAEHRGDVVVVLTNEDQSGSSRNRPQFDITMDRILAGDADGINRVYAQLRNGRGAAEDVELALATVKTRSPMTTCSDCGHPTGTTRLDHAIA
jgi:hypothetical protein